MEIIQLSKKVRPNKHIERNLWNASWEKDLKIAYDIAKKQLPFLGFSTKGAPTQQAIEIMTTHLNFYKNDILKLQIESRRKSITRLATDDFAEKWAALPVRKQQKYALEALYKASAAGADFEYHRRWCPELTVDGLAKDFLDLLMVLVHGDDDEITYFRNPFIEELLKRLDKSVKDPLFTLNIKLDRTFFVTMVLWRMYLSFHDLDEIYRFDPTGQKDADKQLRSSQLFDNKQQKKQYEQLKRDLKAAEAGEANRCWGCGKSEALLPSGTILQVCAGCKKINRKILYCSRECQKDDWKNSKGQLLRHKDICGKPLPQYDPHYMDIDPTQYLRRSSEVIEQLLAEIPITVPGMDIDGENMDASDLPNVDFAGSRSIDKALRPTPSLLYQKRLLKGNSPPDYMLVMKHPESDFGIRIPDAQIRAEFKQARLQAMTSGSAAAVKRMHQILEPFAKHFAPPSYNLKNQLKKEYNVEIVP